MDGHWFQSRQDASTSLFSLMYLYDHPDPQGWSAIGSAAVMIALAKILSDTVKYYDHHGFKNIKMALAIALGTFIAWSVPPCLISTEADISVHTGITFAQVSIYLMIEELTVHVDFSIGPICLSWVCLYCRI
jgi:hypothetical protein